jgi:hypothetical protein
MPDPKSPRRSRQVRSCSGMAYDLQTTFGPMLYPEGFVPAQAFALCTYRAPLLKIFSLSFFSTVEEAIEIGIGPEAAVADEGEDLATVGRKVTEVV